MTLTPTLSHDAAPVQTHAADGYSRRLAPYRPDTETASVIVSERLVEGLVTRRNRRPGPDTDITLLRWLLWIALRTAETGRKWIRATPEEVGKAYDGRTVGGQKRHGMSARNLARHRAAFLARCAQVSQRTPGLYRMKAHKRGEPFLAFDAAFIRRCVYELSAPDLRAAMAAASPASVAMRHGRAKVRAPARFCAVRSGQGRSRWCQAMRRLRVAGVLVDNRPGRKKLERCELADGSVTFRRPVREIALHASPLVPLGRSAIRWTGILHGTGQAAGSAQVGHAKSDPKPTAEQLAPGNDPMQPVTAGEASAVRQPSPASPSPSHADRIGEGALMGAGGDSASASPASPSMASRDMSSAWSDSQRLSNVAVRQIVAESGLVDAREARDASDTACAAIRRACETAGVLRRVLGVKSDELGAAEHPMRWLAAVCRSEGRAVRHPAWVGRATPATARQSSESPAERAARQAMNRAAGDPRAMLVAAETMRQVGERERRPELVEAAALVTDHADAVQRERAAAQVLEDTRQRAATWPLWRRIVERASVELGFCGLRWRGEGDCVLVTGSADEAVVIAWEASERLRLASGDPWRVVVERTDGVRLAEATWAPPAPAVVPEAWVAALARLRARVAHGRLSAWDMRHWLEPLQCEAVSRGVVVLAAPDVAHAEWCRDHFAAELADALGGMAIDWRTYGGTSVGEPALTDLEVGKSALSAPAGESARGDGLAELRRLGWDGEVERDGVPARVARNVYRRQVAGKAG